MMCSLLYNENPVIVAGFNRGFVDEYNVNKKSTQDVLCERLPLKGKALAKTRLRVASNNCMAGRPIYGALVRSQ